MANLKSTKALMTRLRALTDDVTRDLGPGAELSDRERLAILLLDNAYLVLADCAVEHTGEHPQISIVRHKIINALRLLRQTMELHLADDSRVADLFLGGTPDDRRGLDA